MGLHQKLQESLTGRDDLRYTDRVIATLRHEEYEPWYKAVLLNVPEDDISYHVQEIDGMKSNGAAALGIADIRDYRRLAARAESQPIQAPKLVNTAAKERVWSKNPAYYASRNILQIAAEMGCSRDAVYKHCTAHNYQYQKLIAIPTNKPRAKYPEDASWFAARTINAAAAELGIDAKTVARFLRRRGWAYKPNPKKEQYTARFPDDAAFYANKTIKQLTAAMNLSRSAARHFCESRGYAYIQTKPMYKKALPDMPTDAAWYAKRTIKEIMRAMKRSESATRNFLRVRNLPYKRRINRGNKKYEMPEEQNYYASRTIAQLTDELCQTRYQVIHFLRKRGWTYKHNIKPQTIETDLDFNHHANWYAARTIQQARHVIGCTDNQLRRYLKRKGYTYKAVAVPYKKGGK